VLVLRFFGLFAEKLVHRLTSLVRGVMLTVVRMLSLLINRVGMGCDAVVMYDVVLVAVRYLVAKVRKHMQMVGMLFAGSVGMLCVESPIAVVMDL
jgi:type III secretory pathway component EscU